MISTDVNDAFFPIERNAMPSSVKNGAEHIRAAILKLRRKQYSVDSLHEQHSRFHWLLYRKKELNSRSRKAYIEHM